MKWRSIFRNAHLIAGLVVGLIATAVGLSGSILTFREDIEHALYEPKVVSPATTIALKTAYASALAAQGDQRRITVIVMPENSESPLEFVSSLRGARSLKEADQISYYANPFSGAIIGQRRRNDSFIAWMRDLHFALLGGLTGYKINGWAALTLVFISLSGLALWFQTKMRGKSFAVNFASSWKRITWDLHRLVGLFAFLLLMLVALTGAYYPFREQFLNMISSAGTPLPPRGAPLVAPKSDTAPLDLEQIELKARSVIADAAVAVLRPPTTPTQAWTVTWHRSGDEGESVDSGPTAYFDPYTGATIRLDDPRTMSGAARLLKAIEPLHFGKFAGLPNKLLWFVLGLSPLFLFASGVVMWWNRTRGTRRAWLAKPVSNVAEVIPENAARVSEGTERG